MTNDDHIRQNGVGQRRFCPCGWIASISAALLMLGCASVLATPLPPLPPMPPGVKRPAPLLSPSHAAKPKSKAMVKAGAFTPAGQPNKFYLTHQLDFDIDGDGKIIRDVTQIEFPQPAGKGVRAECTDDLMLWTTIADWSPHPVAQTIVVQQWCMKSQRAKVRTFRVVEYVNSPGLKRVAAAAYRLNPEGNGVRTWVKPK